MDLQHRNGTIEEGLWLRERIPESFDSVFGFNAETLDFQVGRTLFESEGLTTSVARFGHIEKRTPDLTSKTHSIAQASRTLSKEICNHCHGLNLDKLLAAMEEPIYRKRQYPAPWVKDKYGAVQSFGGMPVVKVGHRYRTSKYARCLLCEMILASRIDEVGEPGEIGTELQEGGDEIRAVELPLFATSLMPLEGNARIRAVSLILVSQGVFHDKDYLHRFHLNDTIRDHARFAGCLILFQGPLQLSMLGPKTIPQVFDTCTTKSWLQYCLRNHASPCHHEQLPTRGVQVIDCDTRLVEDCSATNPFVALSYVWGPANPVHSLVWDEQGRRTLPKSLPPVVQDSIQVTKALGYRYLWVDKFCIDQENLMVKCDQIQQMDAIYQNAELTIIAAAGQDESYGLPGVGLRSRTQQSVMTLDGATALWSPEAPYETIQQSRWATRGWTFQEAALSRRRLVFTEHQVYFQCRTMNCFESAYHPLDMMHTENKAETHDWLPGGIFDQDRQDETGAAGTRKNRMSETLISYMASVENYTGRTLRFAEDSLDAFQGILANLSKVKEPLHHVWGLAYLRESAMTLEGVRGIVQSCAWTHRSDFESPKRRSQFPSWTWAGWQGQVVYAPSPAIYNLVRRLRFRNARSDLIKLEAVQEEKRHPTILNISTQVVQMTPDAFQPADDSDCPWILHGQRSKLSWSYDSQSEEELLQSFQDTKTWQFALIGGLDGTYVMVLKSCPGKGTWQRAGMFCINMGAIHFNRLLGRTLHTFDIE